MKDLEIGTVLILATDLEHFHIYKVIEINNYEVRMKVIYSSITKNQLGLESVWPHIHMNALEKAGNLYFMKELLNEAISSKNQYF